MLNPISTPHIKRDLYGGVTAAIVALPLALAFGGASGACATPKGTMVTIQAGGRSALSGISRALILMVVILAGIALRVGVDIVDWGFIQRAHRSSSSGAVIMDPVIALTVLMDLIEAVGVGVFMANILTIDKMSALQSNSVKSVSTGDGDLMIPESERTSISRYQALQQAVASLA